MWSFVHFKCQHSSVQVIHSVDHQIIPTKFYGTMMLTVCGIQLVFEGGSYFQHSLSAAGLEATV